MPADSPTTGQWPDSDQQQTSPTHYALSGKIMLASITTLFLLVVLLVLFHIYARWHFLLRRRNHTPRSPSNSTNRSTRLVYYINSNRSALANSPSGGLHAAVMKLLPAFVHSSETDAHSPECSVCLSEFEDGEKGRILPNCKHRFHTECIDMWFFSNSTCPLCRSPVEPVITEMTSLSDVTDVMETTSLADGMKRVDVRVDVPNVNHDSVTENIEVRLPSPGSRLLSLKRMISMGRKLPAVAPSSGVGSSCGSGATESDIESGESQ